VTFDTIAGLENKKISIEGVIRVNTIVTTILNNGPCVGDIAQFEF
jgi:hypothetical protein